MEAELITSNANKELKFLDKNEWHQIGIYAHMMQF